MMIALCCTSCHKAGVAAILAHVHPLTVALHDVNPLLYTYAEDPSANEIAPPCKKEIDTTYKRPTIAMMRLSQGAKS